MRSIRVLVPLLALTLAAAAAIAQPPPPPPPLTPLPPPPQPPGNQVTTAKANLGKTLFWDEQVASTRTMACGSCHQAGSGGSDPRTGLFSAHTTHPGPDATFDTGDDITGSPGVVLNHPAGAFDWSSSFGIAPQVTGRYAPSFINAAYAPQLFWDGRAQGTFLDPITGATVLQNGGALENQATGPPASSAEMGHIGRNWLDVVERVASSMPLALSPRIPTDLAAWIGGRSYTDLFAEAFGSATVTAARIALAIASYERTLFSTQAPIDSVIAGTATLTPQENAGMQLFGQLGCAGCHAGSLFSDNQFHYIGVRPAAEDSGRMVVTHQLQNLGEMRTPSLRNVALRSRFMHNGRLTSLEEVVDFYDRGGDFDAPNKPPAIRPLNLTPNQKAQLLAFLRRPLTDPRVANRTAPFDQPVLFTESALVPQILAGTGVSGASGEAPQVVALEPAIAGNPRFTVGVHGGPAGADAVLVVDDAEPAASGAIPATASFARASTVLQSDGAAGGFASATLAIPDDPSNYGRVLYGRWYVADPGAASGVATSDAFRVRVFGPNGAGALVAVDPTPSAVPVLMLSASEPNPFVDATAVRFRLPEATRAQLRVFDVSGRVVRRLLDRASAAPGSYAVTWDGRDDHGRAVPGGMYFYRLDTIRGTATSRVARLQ